jgi:hypothetical protein
MTILNKKQKKQIGITIFKLTNQFCKAATNKRVFRRLEDTFCYNLKYYAETALMGRFGSAESYKSKSEKAIIRARELDKNYKLRKM